MNFLKGKLQAFGASTSAFMDSTSEKTAKKFGQVKGLLNKALEASPAPESTLVRVMERVYWMPYPEKSKLEPVAKLLQSLFSSNYKIWDLSEEGYETGLFGDRTVAVRTVGYPHPPLLSLHQVAVQVAEFLGMDPSNVAIVHCQGTGYRSVMALGFASYILKNASNPQEGIEACGEVCSKVTYENQT